MVNGLTCEYSLDTMLCMTDDPYSHLPDAVHPFKNYKPKANIQEIHSVGLITEEELAGIERLSKDELIAIIERMARQCGLVACMNEEDIRRAFLDRMAYIGLTGKAEQALAAMEKRMDRVDGKPMQRQQSLIAVAEVKRTLPENDRAVLEHYFKIRGLTKPTGSE